MTTTTTTGSPGNSGMPEPQPFTEHVAELLVQSREQVADDVVALTLVHPDGEQLPPWTPGAHVDLLLTDDLLRQYSLCGSPEDRSRWRVAVLREPAGRGGSAHVHDAVPAGARVRVRGPRNHFPLLEAPSYVFVGGGVGITPLLAMVAHAQARGADWSLLYGGRRRSSMAFVDELSAHGERLRTWPEDEKGLLPLVEVLGTPRPGTLVYACGPEGLLQAVEQHCATWPSGSLHLERFAPKPLADTGPATTFEVVCERSGQTLQVPPDRSILEVAEQAGIHVLSSCQEGVCGTCETAVVEGVPDHRDSLLSQEERDANDYMMICVSRCAGDRLVLDL